MKPSPPSGYRRIGPCEHVFHGDSLGKEDGYGGIIITKQVPESFCGMEAKKAKSMTPLFYDIYRPCLIGFECASYVSLPKEAKIYPNDILIIAGHELGPFRLEDCKWSKQVNFIENGYLRVKSMYYDIVEKTIQDVSDKYCYELMCFRLSVEEPKAKISKNYLYAKALPLP